MKKSIAKKWVKALRSGEYKQGRNYLRKGDKFCCLGVLCDLAVKEGQIDVINSDSKLYYYAQSSGVLPLRVMKWAGIDHEEGMVGNTFLTTLNDEGKSFEKIADIIEKNMEKL